jgi:predicted nucleic-acid-binding Zn-ribbon protein
MILDQERKFRILFNETTKVYHIQKKRFFGYKSLMFKYRELYKAQAKVDILRREFSKIKTKNNYIVVDY